MGIGQSERLHWAVTEGLTPALGHDLDRQAAVEIRRRGLKIVEGDLIAGEQRVDEGRILSARQRTIDIVRPRSAGSRLVIARLQPSDRHVDRIAVHDRRDRVEKCQRLFAGQLRYDIRKRRRGEGTGRDDDIVPVLRRWARDLLATKLDQRMGFERGGDRGRKAIAIDRQRAAGRHLIGIGRPHHQRAEAAHFLVQQANGIVLRIIGAERVRAHQLGKPRGLVHGGHAQRAHLVEHHRHPARCDLPGRLAAAEAAADDMNGCCRGLVHGGKLCRPAAPDNGLRRRKCPARRAFPRAHRRSPSSAFGGIPGDPRDIRPRDPDIGQLAVAELRQLAQARVVSFPNSGRSEGW